VYNKNVVGVYYLNKEKQKTNKERKNYYIDKEELAKEIAKYKKTGVMSEELGEMFLKIATRFSNTPSFRNYTWREDMVAEAVLTCIKYCKSCDPDRPDTVFSYFTKTCYRRFLQYIKKQKRHSEIKDKCMKGASKISNFKEEEGIIGINYEDIKKND